MPEPPSDAELIRTSVGQPEVFALVFERHYEVIRRYLQRRGGHELGEELAAQTFEEAFLARGRYRAQYPSAKPWLLGIATNLLRKHMRGDDAHRRALARHAGRREIHDRDIERADERLLAQLHRGPLIEAVASLEDRDRDVLLLFAWNDLTYEEIAVALGIPVGTVRSRLNRARRQLRELIGPLEAIDGGEEKHDLDE